MFKSSCHPMLIGSLPLTDHQAAMELIARHCSELPLWPQLPKLRGQGMVRQFLTGLPGLVDLDKRSYVDTGAPDFLDDMARFYESALAIEEKPELLADSRFALGRDTAAGFFALEDYLAYPSSPYLTAKGQVTGPVTAGIGMKNKEGASIIYDDSLRDILVRLLALKACWQVDRLSPFTGSQPVIIMIDEPGLVSFGSSGFAGVSEEMVVDSVGQVISAIQGRGGLAGVHICANGDWGPSLRSQADIISFDAYFYFENFILFREPLKDFLQRGGILAWGIVPTGDPQAVAMETSESLFDKWLKQLSRLAELSGMTGSAIMTQTLIAPSCGTGSLPPELAEKVLAMTSDLSKKAREHLADAAAS